MSKVAVPSVGQVSWGRVRMASAAAAVRSGFRTCLARMLKILTSFSGIRPRQKRAASCAVPETERAL